MRDPRARFCSRRCRDIARYHPIGKAIWECRKKNPDWGPTKISQYLKCNYNTVRGIIYRRQDLYGEPPPVPETRQRKKKDPLAPQKAYGKHVAPRDLWNMDAVEKEHAEILQRGGRKAKP